MLKKCEAVNRVMRWRQRETDKRHEERKVHTVSSCDVQHMDMLRCCYTKYVLNLDSDIFIPFLGRLWGDSQTPICQITSIQK